MKKILIGLMALTVAAMADNFVIGTNLGYAKASTTASTSTASASADSKATTYGINAGYETGNIRLGLYKNISNIRDGEDSQSMGGYVDYLIDYQSGNKFFIGGLYGKGDQDLAGSSEIDFKDKGIRGGILLDYFPAEVELGIRQVWRSYDSIVVNGTTVSGDSKIFNVYVGINYKL